VASDELIASWQRTQRHLRDALARQKLPEDVRATTLDLIAHNEYGVAFEYLVNVLAESDAELTEPARRVLASAALEMGLDDNPDWLALST